MNNIQNTLRNLPKPGLVAQLILALAVALSLAVIAHSWPEFSSLATGAQIQAVLYIVMIISIIVGISMEKRDFVFFMAILSCGIQPAIFGYQFMALYDQARGIVDPVHTVLYVGKILALLAALPFCLGFYYKEAGDLAS